MGTRADFYAGRGEQAEWLGSIGWDGYPEGIAEDILSASTIEAYKAALSRFFAGRNDATLPRMGWPWPWEDSHTTDYAYAFDGGQVYASSFGHGWRNAIDAASGKADDWDDKKTAVFPNMTDRTNVALGKRSGLVVVTA